MNLIFTLVSGFEALCEVYEALNLIEERCYLLILGGEARPVQLVERHHHGHHVLTVHDGDGEDTLGLVLRQLVHKFAVVSALCREREREFD